MTESLWGFFALAGAVTLVAVAAGDAPPLEPAVLEAWSLLDEQPAAASARMATTPADFTALERFTWELPFTCSGAARRAEGWWSWRREGQRPAATGRRRRLQPGPFRRRRPARTAGPR